METIFDHNITQQEMEFVVGTPNMKKDFYQSYRNKRGIYEDLYLLYLFRKNKKKAYEYYEKAQEIEFVFRVDNYIEMLLGEEKN